MIGDLPDLVETQFQNYKDKFVLIKLDDFEPVPGQIVETDTKAGKCKMLVYNADGELKIEEFSFPGGIRLVRK